MSEDNYLEQCAQAEFLDDEINKERLEPWPDEIIKDVLRLEEKHDIELVSIDHHEKFVKENETLQARVAELESFAKTIRDDYDCDADAHKYGTICRACEAKRILREND